MQTVFLVAISCTIQQSKGFHSIYCGVDIGNPEMIHSMEVTHKILHIKQLFMLET